MTRGVIDLAGRLKTQCRKKVGKIIAIRIYGCNVVAIRILWTWTGRYERAIRRVKLRINIVRYIEMIAGGVCRKGVSRGSVGGASGRRVQQLNGFYREEMDRPRRIHPVEIGISSIAGVRGRRRLVGYRSLHGRGSKWWVLSPPGQNGHGWCAPNSRAVDAPN